MRLAISTDADDKPTLPEGCTCSVVQGAHDGGWNLRYQEGCPVHTPADKSPREVIADFNRRYFSTELPYGPAYMLLRELTAAGFHLVREGEAVVDGEVVSVVRWSHSLLQVNRLKDHDD